MFVVRLKKYSKSGKTKNRIPIVIKPLNKPNIPTFKESLRLCSLNIKYPKRLTKSIEEALATNGLKVIIVKRECGLQAFRRRQRIIREIEDKGENYQDIIYQVYSCQMCYDCARILSCPAIRRTEIDGKETMQIDEDRFRS